jgi:hypothetical protein
MNEWNASRALLVIEIAKQYLNVYIQIFICLFLKFVAMLRNKEREKENYDLELNIFIFEAAEIIIKC